MSADPDWEAVRRDYENHSIPTKNIVTKFGISADRIYRRAIVGDWVRRPSLAARRAAAAARQTSARQPEALSNAAERDESLEPANGVQVSGSADVKPLKPIAKRRAILNRLTNAIDTKLTLLERRFERELTGLSVTGKALSAADFERDTRNIGLLIKNLEQVTEFDHAHLLARRATGGGTSQLHGAAAKSVNLAAAALADEADRLRRELAERLQRLVDPAG